MEYIVLVVSAIIIPLILFIYSLISYKKKIIICTINNNNNMKVTKDSYYSFQLLFCIINCILLIFESVMTINSISFFVCYYIATFWLMNYLLKFISIKMKYVNMSCE
jgi:hypothetical protein